MVNSGLYIWQQGTQLTHPGNVLERYRKGLPSGKLTKNYGKSPFLMGKSVNQL